MSDETMIGQQSIKKDQAGLLGVCEDHLFDGKLLSVGGVKRPRSEASDVDEARR